MSDEAIIQAAARVLIKAALSTVQSDPHVWSTRPCETCRIVTAIMGEPFGCYALAKRPTSPTPAEPK